MRHESGDGSAHSDLFWYPNPGRSAPYSDKTTENTECEIIYLVKEGHSPPRVQAKKPIDSDAADNGERRAFSDETAQSVDESMTNAPTRDEIDAKLERTEARVEASFARVENAANRVHDSHQSISERLDTIERSIEKQERSNEKQENRTRWIIGIILAAGIGFGGIVANDFSGRFGQINDRLDRMPSEMRGIADSITGAVTAARAIEDRPQFNVVLPEAIIEAPSEQSDTPSDEE